LPPGKDDPGGEAVAGQLDNKLIRCARRPLIAQGLVMSTASWRPAPIVALSMASAGRGPVVLAAMAARVPPAPGGLRGRGTVPRTGRRAGRLSNARRAPPAQVPVRREVPPGRWRAA